MMQCIFTFKKIDKSEGKFLSWENLPISEQPHICITIAMLLVNFCVLERIYYTLLAC